MRFDVKGRDGRTFLTAGNLSDRPKTNGCKLAFMMCTLCSTTLCAFCMSMNSLSATDGAHRDP